MKVIHTWSCAHGSSVMCFQSLAPSCTHPPMHSHAYRLNCPFVENACQVSNPECQEGEVRGQSSACQECSVSSMCVGLDLGCEPRASSLLPLHP